MTTTRKVFKGGVSGIAATCVDLTALVALVEIFGVHVTFAAFFGAAAGAVVNFVINKFWTFRCTRPIDYKQVSVFALVALGTCLFVAGAVHVLAVWMGIPYVLAKGVAAVMAFLLWTYPAQAKLVFTGAPAPRARRAAA